ncbi:MAG: DJ-1/PfpI family protein [Armatimonadota bacterium]
MDLTGKRIAILIAMGYHEHELLFPYYRLKEAGAEVIVAGPEANATVYGEGRHGMDGLPFETEAAIGDLKVHDLDAIHLPGGIYGPMFLRDREDVCALVRAMVERNKIVGAICHAPWILVSADVVRGRKIACPGDMAPDVKNAGGVYVPRGVVRDANIVTGEYFAHLPEYIGVFMAAVKEANPRAR